MLTQEIGVAGKNAGVPLSMTSGREPLSSLHGAGPRDPEGTTPTLFFAFWVQENDLVALNFFEALKCRFAAKGNEGNIILHHSDDPPSDRSKDWNLLLSVDMGQQGGYFCQGKNRRTKEIIEVEGAGLVWVINSYVLTRPKPRANKVPIVDRVAKQFERAFFS